MNYIEIKQEIQIKIGQAVNMRVNIITNFNIMKNLRFVESLTHAPSVLHVDNIASYDDGSSGIAVTLVKDADVLTLQKNIEQILFNSLF